MDRNACCELMMTDLRAHSGCSRSLTSGVLPIPVISKDLSCSLISFTVGVKVLPPAPDTSRHLQATPLVNLRSKSRPP